jgi:hypothetical protein
MFKSEGRLIYSHSGDEYKLIVAVDKGIVDYYRSLVPKHVGLRQQRYDPHITVVRNEIPPYLEEWQPNTCISDTLFYNEWVEFEYSHKIGWDDIYWWLPVYCDELAWIRQKLGLEPSSQWTRPPDDSDCFHITIGNCK